MSFVFYDTETTGTDTTFDQILQFAAIRTDDDLNELERFEVRCRLLPHVVPAPMALAVTRVTPDLLEDLGLPTHAEAMGRIAERFEAWSPACFIGYNSLSFDENLLRQAFYQTLHPTYLTNTNGNTRADVYRLVLAASVHAPEVLEIPLGTNGKPSRKLDAIAPANGFDHANAHDALADVEATIFVANLVKNDAPDLWSAMMDMTTKAGVVQRLRDGHPVVQTEVFGQKAHNRLVIGFATNPDYDAEVGVFDLSFDPEPYLDLSVDELVDVLKANPRPLRIVRANAQPILIEPSEVGEGVKSELPDFDDAIRRADVVLGDEEFCRRVGVAASKRYPEREPGKWVEEQIYEGFASNVDVQRMREFHGASIENRLRIALEFEDRRLRELAFRQMYFEAPETLEPKVRDWFEVWRVDRVTDLENTGRVRSWASAHAEVLELAKDPGDLDPSLISEIADWYASKLATSVTH